MKELRRIRRSIVRSRTTKNTKISLYTKKKYHCRKKGLKRGNTRAARETKIEIIESKKKLN